jgi:hypothetical protein
MYIALQYNRLAYFCFVDLEKAFDKLELKTEPDILERNNVPNALVIFIKYIYINKFITVKCDSKTSGKIPVQKAARQGDSLSPLLFKLVVKEIIKEVNRKKRYRMSNKQINIIC